MYCYNLSIIFLLLATVSAAAEITPAEELVDYVLSRTLTGQGSYKESMREPNYEFLIRSWQEQKAMTSEERFRTSGIILKKHAASFFAQVSTVIDFQTSDDLQVLSSHKVALAAHIDRAHLHAGKLFLRLLLMQPTDDVDCLKKRQLVVRELVENKTLYNELFQALQQLQTHEHTMLALWQNDPLSQAVDDNYPNQHLESAFGEHIRYNEGVVSVMTATHYGEHVLEGFVSALSLSILPAYLFFKARGKGAQYPLLSWAGEKVYAGADKIYTVLSLIDSPLLQCVTYPLLALWSTNSFLEAANKISNNALAIEIVQEKLISSALFLSQARRIAQCLQENSCFSKNLTLARHLQLLLRTADDMDTELAAITQSLQGNTFKGDTSALSRQGKVLTVFRFLQDKRACLEKIISALAEIDAYLSLATLFNEHATTPARYCFVDIVESATATLKIDEGWHPLLSADRVVTNSIAFGDDVAERVIVITGPNAGGKTTIAKSIILAALFAQCFGIAPGRRVAINPFSLLADYMNVPDDIGSGNSLFRAQVQKIDRIFSKIRLLPASAFWLAFLDEPFTGTNMREGEALTFSVAKQMARFPNGICCITTHMPMLITLAEDSPLFANYKVSAFIEQGGTIKYPFLLQQGSSTECMAISLVKAEGFSSEILDDALALYSSKKEKNDV